MPGWAWAARVAAWDAALAAVRACLRGHGMREAPTPVLLEELALEPWIEPVRVERTGGPVAPDGATRAGIEPVRAGAAWLQTSPELAMKRLVARGSGSIFQIAA